MKDLYSFKRTTATTKKKKWNTHTHKKKMNMLVSTFFLCCSFFFLSRALMQEYGGDLGHGVLSRRAVSIESRRVKKKKKNTVWRRRRSIDDAQRNTEKLLLFFFLSLSDSTRFPHRSANARAVYAMARKRRTKLTFLPFFSHFFFKMFANTHVRKYMQSYLISCLEKGSVRRATHYSLILPIAIALFFLFYFC